MVSPLFGVYNTSLVFLLSLQVLPLAACMSLATASWRTSQDRWSLHTTWSPYYNFKLPPSPFLSPPHLPRHEGSKVGWYARVAHIAARQLLDEAVPHVVGAHHRELAHLTAGPPDAASTVSSQRERLNKRRWRGVRHVRAHLSQPTSRHSVTELACSEKRAKLTPVRPAAPRPASVGVPHAHTHPWVAAAHATAGSMHAATRGAKERTTGRGKSDRVGVNSFHRGRAAHRWAWTAPAERRRPPGKRAPALPSQPPASSATAVAESSCASWLHGATHGAGAYEVAHRRER